MVPLLLCAFQEMLDFCGEHNVVSSIEMVTGDKINEVRMSCLANHVTQHQCG